MLHGQKGWGTLADDVVSLVMIQTSNSTEWYTYFKWVNCTARIMLYIKLFQKSQKRKKPHIPGSQVVITVARQVGSG